jgi:hypothetical protein
LIIFDARFSQPGVDVYGSSGRSVANSSFVFVQLVAGNAKMGCIAGGVTHLRTTISPCSACCAATQRWDVSREVSHSPLCWRTVRQPSIASVFAACGQHAALQFCNTRMGCIGGGVAQTTVLARRRTTISLYCLCLRWDVTREVSRRLLCQ